MPRVSSPPQSSFVQSCGPVDDDRDGSAGLLDGNQKAAVFGDVEITEWESGSPEVFYLWIEQGFGRAGLKAPGRFSFHLGSRPLSSRGYEVKFLAVAAPSRARTAVDRYWPFAARTGKRLHVNLIAFRFI